jgi:small subunit ribosomal protein S3
MGNKINPIATRLCNLGWKSATWFSSKSYAKYVAEDYKIRSIVEKHLEKGIFSNIEISRSNNEVVITIITHKAGVVIGKEGSNLKRLKEKLQKEIAFDARKVILNVSESYRAESDCRIIACSIAKQMENRMNYKKAVKGAIRFAMKAGVTGIRVIVSGRLGGSAISREETYMQGQLPLSNLRHNIQYWHEQAITVYGICGVKVYVNMGVDNVNSI